MLQAVEGLPDVAEITENLDRLEEGLDIEEDVEEELEVKLCFAPKSEGVSSRSSGIAIADVIETNFAVRDIDVQDVAIALAEDLEGLGRPHGQTVENLCPHISKDLVLSQT